LHERLIPLLYDPTNLGQLTVTSLVGSQPLALAIVIAAMSTGVYLIGRIWNHDRTID
jgi:hypothetical protein